MALSPIQKLAEKLGKAQSVILSTHRHCDGDGLGSELALLHGLRQLGKKVRILNVDRPSDKYAYLETDRLIEIFNPETKLPPADLALIFDTNDRRLLEPLFSELEKACQEVLFIDHHPALSEGPAPTAGSLIDTSAASTGQIVFELFRELGLEINPPVARALYTSLVFDTQMFRYVKSDPRSHIMAVELLKVERSPEDVHRALFATYSVEKMGFLARSLGRVEYFNENRVAFVAIPGEDIVTSGVDPDSTGDVIDLLMNIESVQVAALIREDGTDAWKVSLRSKGGVPVLPLAEILGGGGHIAAAGAYVKGDRNQLRQQILKELDALLKPRRRATDR